MKYHRIPIMNTVFNPSKANFRNEIGLPSESMIICIAHLVHSQKLGDNAATSHLIARLLCNYCWIFKNFHLLGLSQLHDSFAFEFISFFRDQQSTRYIDLERSQVLHNNVDFLTHLSSLCLHIMCYDMKFSTRLWLLFYDRLFFYFLFFFLEI